jgi:hypothetical protein
MIERDGEVSVKRQAELLDLSRSSVHYVARSLPERDLKPFRLTSSPGSRLSWVVGIGGCISPMIAKFP